MWKPLVVLAIVANTALITPSEGTYRNGPYPEKCGHGNPHCKCKKPNEIYDLCPNPCPPRECGIDKALILCAPAPKPGSKACKPGCICADGFARNRAGICIPEDECEYDCAKNETLDPCYSGCPPRLCGVNIAAVSCLAIDEDDCEPGCRCSDGYLLNAEGDCVLEQDCPRCTNPNEVYDIRPAPCPPRRCDVDETLIDCKPPPRPGDPECEPGCRCADGFVRNPDGICVTRDQCPQCTGPNEVYDICPNPCPPQRCDVDPRVIRCAAPPEPGDPNCNPGCRCIYGYVRNEEGICVTRDQCPQNCKGEHEIYSRCPALECRPLNCTQVGFPQPCPDPGPDGRCPGKPGCICENGYARNSRGKCIPIKECSSCGGDPNAVSGCGVNCGRHCSDRNKKYPVNCIDICIENGCDCREGFWYDDNTGKCVLSKDCTPVCGQDEVYSACINADCQPKNCSQLGYPIACPRIDPAYCIKGCTCKEGYARAANGTCIPKEKCPSCRGDPNAVSGCGQNCGRRCSNYNSKKPVICPDICELNGCDCREGFVLDDSTGKCIPPKQCVSCAGDFNAKPGCDKNCTKRCPGPKPSECKCYKDGCECKDGFVYDPKANKCVRLEECTPPCGNNEVLSNCSNGGCGPWRCTDVGIPTGCVKMDQKYCIVDCVCQKGYVRDDKEVCIPVTDCPECGGDPNAVAGCGINCGRLCSNYKNAENISCITVCYENACDCRKDYVLDENTNRCVLPQDCTPTCGKNEVFSPCVNGECQAKNCSQIGEPVPCVKPAKCKPGCLCGEGYLRDAYGNCIPKEQCPPKCRGANEIYDLCPPTCPPQTCESIGGRYFCPLMPTNRTCHGACRCKPNYFRNKLGDCISKENCLKCRGPHEFFSCGGACDNVCETLDERNQTNCPIINIKCNDMCYCEEGYARDKNNTCIPIDQCPEKCSENERWEECPARLCSPQSCKDLGFEISCDNAENSTCPGPPGCVCDYDLVRDKNGKCIPKKDCPSCGGDPNAEAGCGLNCGRLCSNYNKGPVPCPRICFPNSCDCKKDYVFDENIKKCVPPKHCTPVCKEHEVFAECTNGGCQARNCSQLGQSVPCIKMDPKYCIKGCVCEEGYLRARNGTCVPKDKCDNCNKPHEHYDPCAPSCPPQTCESIGREYDCPICAAVCRGSCRCDKGYYRNKIGECIRKSDCLKCKGPHEYFSCGGACDNVCSTLYKQNQTNCPIKNIKCNPMCYCEKGYARNKHNICIPIDECPRPRCGVNERLEQCPPGLCTPQKCSELGFSIACPDLPENGCPEPPGCVCIDDYVRDSRGRCIPSRSCPSCGGDPNAESGCGTNCGRTCSTYNKTGIGCAAVCYINGCDCRKGFVFDDNLKICVRPKDCTPICKKNEVYDSCANGRCGKWNCSQLGEPDLCIDVIECIGGCICQEGYLRAKNGTCVPINQCPIKCTGPNEYFSCGGACDNVCETLNEQNQTNCPIVNVVCNPMCYCEEGYARNDNNTCVPINQCPPPKCGENERLEDCPDSLCTPQYCSQLGYPIDCPALQIDSNQTDCPGKPGCVCIDNYAKNDQGKCIPIDDCPSCGGDPNAVSGCGSNCGRLCSNYKKKNVVCPFICRLNGCDCRDGYVFDSNIGRCVRPKDCTPVCSLNEVYDICANGGCQKRNCSQVGGHILCIDPIKCTGGCVCREGYLRNKNGTCVPENQCPLKCTKLHEVYDSCPHTCPPQTCAAIGVAYPCPHPPEGDEFCQPACRCEDGYYRNSVDECISEADCLKCTGPNEHFSCGPACDNVCSTLATQNQTNCPIKNKRCVSKCYCDEGYARDDNDICIPIDQCGVSCNGDPNAIPGCGNHCGNRCSDYNKGVFACPLFCLQNGCNCKQGYVFDDNLGTCVLPKDCTPACGNNKVYNSCINGGCQKKQCSDLGCPDICVRPKKCIGGCLCAEGFLRADNGTCVPINECPAPFCPNNEVFDTCSNGRCNRRKCSELTGPIICKDPFECIGDCVCVEGFLRNDDGVCVPERECNPQCYGPHQVFDPCPYTCPPQTCESLGRAYICPIEWGQEPPCQPGCVCEEGYYKNKIGECLTEEECLRCMGPHEYYSCGGACDNVCETLNEQSQDNCPIVNIKCNEMCYCEEGYARNSSNICIPIKDCPPSRCGPDERYEESPCRICEPLTCCEVGMEMECPPVEDNDCDDTPACICKYGLVRNDEGVCIPISECRE